MNNIDMLWTKDIKPLLFRLIGYSYAIVVGNLFYKCTYEAYHESYNITLGSMEMRPIIWFKLLQRKTDNLWQKLYIVAVTTALAASSDLRNTIIWESNFRMILIVTPITLILLSASERRAKEDSYKYFICNSGLDCGSFMAYSLYHGYIKYVVASNGDVNSKGLVERMQDYEAKHKVNFPIKKLLILQPKSMFIPPTLKTELIQDAENLEEVKINRGGVANRSYQLSVYKYSSEQVRSG